MKYKQKPRVSIIIPSYNPGKLLERCLVSIPSNGIEIIVVDNGSVYSEVHKTAEKHPRARFLFLGTNTGFAHASNLGAGLARGEVLLFLNQDAEVIDNGFWSVLEFLESSLESGIATGRVIYPDGSLQQTLRRFPGYASILFGRRTPLTSLFPGNPYSSRYMYEDILREATIPQRIQACTGMFMMVKRKIFERLGGFDEDFFFYVEDIDLCKRAADQGYETWFVPEVTALHHVGENVPGTDRTYVKMHHYKGLYRYFKKHLNPKWLLKALLWTAAGMAVVGHLAFHKLLREVRGR